MLQSLFWLRRFWVRYAWRLVSLRRHSRMLWWVTLLRRGQPLASALASVSTSREETTESGGREVRLISSEPVRLDQDYRDWISPLQTLSPDTTVTQLKRAAETLPGYVPEGQLFFPLTQYLGAFERYATWDVEFVHRCRPSQIVATSTTSQNVSTAPHEPLQPRLLWIYTRPRQTISK